MLYTVTITAAVETPMPAAPTEVEDAAIAALLADSLFWVHNVGWAQWSLVSAKALAVAEMTHNA